MGLNLPGMAAILAGIVFKSLNFEHKCDDDVGE